jgi:hypothetical protein
MEIPRCLEKILYNKKPKKIMGYYRNTDGPKDESDKPNDMKLEAVMHHVDNFNELPEDIYSELIQRTLKMAERMAGRKEELQETFGKSGIKNLNDEAYWKTSMVEQVAFLEMQVANIGMVIHHLTNK